MAETRRRFDPQFREGAVRIVRETGKSIAQVARDLGINEGTLANWVNKDREARGEADAGGLSEDERVELARLRRGNAELAMARDVRTRSVVGWVIHEGAGPVKSLLNGAWVVFRVVPAGFWAGVCAASRSRRSARRRSRGRTALRATPCAMLVGPGRRDVQDVVSGRVFATVEPVVGGRPGLRLPVIHSPREHEVRCSGAWCGATRIGRGQSRPRLRRQLSGAIPPRDHAPDRTEDHAAPDPVPVGVGRGWRARMWPSRRP
jgi:transposase